MSTVVRYILIATLTAAVTIGVLTEAEYRALVRDLLEVPTAAKIMDSMR